jgi:hypothetical protein
MLLLSCLASLDTKLPGWNLCGIDVFHACPEAGKDPGREASCARVNKGSAGQVSVLVVSSPTNPPQRRSSKMTSSG